ncbi:MAG: PilN domain-containing protein [Pirellulales bacterium]|nr:PilN domain-containing protein [Pirellulales bacterium]
MKTHLNLLSFDYRRRQFLRGWLLRWSLVWAACVVLAAVPCWLKQVRYGIADRKLQTAQRRYAPVDKLAREVDAMSAELRTLEAKGTVLGQVRDDRPLGTLIGLASRSARRCNGRLVVRKLSFQRQQPQSEQNKPPRGRSTKQADSPPAPKKRLPWAAVTFSGEALDNVAVATFVVGLRDTGLFRRVELKSSVGKDAPNAEIRSYVLECDI